MTAEVIGALVDGAIPLLGGLFATAWAFGLLGGDQSSKARDALKVLGPLLLVYGGVAMGLGLVRATPDEEDLRALFVASANTQAGQMVDPDTRLEGVVDRGDHIGFEYRIVSYTVADMDVESLRAALSETMLVNLCDNELHRLALERWGPFRIEYLDKEGAEVVTLSMVGCD